MKYQINLHLSISVKKILTKMTPPVKIDISTFEILKILTFRVDKMVEMSNAAVSNNFCQRILV